MLEATRSTLFRQDFLEEAVALSASTLNARRPRLEAELKAVETKVAKTESGLERYFRAFEEGSLREDQCISRIQKLTMELTELKARRDELADDLNAEEPKVPDAEDLAALRREMESALQEGSLPQRKAVLQRFIEEIRVTDRGRITPVFRVGEVFAPLYGSVPPKREPYKGDEGVSSNASPGQRHIPAWEVEKQSTMIPRPRVDWR